MVQQVRTCDMPPSPRLHETCRRRRCSAHCVPPSDLLGRLGQKPNPPVAARSLLPCAKASEASPRNRCCTNACPPRNPRFALPCPVLPRTCNQSYDSSPLPNSVSPPGCFVVRMRSIQSVLQSTKSIAPPPNNPPGLACFHGLLAMGGLRSRPSTCLCRGPMMSRLRMI
ncbi:hypothetical protein B0T26DRAFT_720225, partial [Lasiosphaeria miniovina]